MANLSAWTGLGVNMLTVFSTLMAKLSRRFNMHLTARPRAKRNPDDIDALVLAGLRESAIALSAYQIVDRLCASGNRLTATQAYRTLGRLISQRKVRRIETLSAYVAIDGDFDVVLVCNCCGTLRPLTEPVLKRQIAGLAQAHRFAIDRIALEIVGSCPQCAQSAMA
ncbi:Fur family zinc uptake transcriptional regulator [Sphingobium xenophagum]|uniref:Fur family zinc uptake transcriptional regulator n=1 Tax=Sphingobium xenophagum TaxID=121428 RepID=A0ABU1WZS6_SPHXE|nr:transcriptional repressor [Sphingobium xenophagum]MDR7154818.1 Fur family zinc uptake transcriptional regulator [Sphingobium xenophagum]